VLTETESFDELYRVTRDRLAVQITALTGDPFEANDLVQEAFMRAWLRWDKLAGYEDPEGWIRRVAYNLAVSRWRQARRVVLRATVPQAHGERPGERIGVLEALKSLPSSERRAVVLHHVAGLSVADVAVELNAPEGTVKSWLSRGRAGIALQMFETPAVHDPVAARGGSTDD
jgi:RNA polymerase sigma-70 factor (ECF subfamily)